MEFVHHMYIFQVLLAAISFILNGLFLIVLVDNKDLVKRKRITYHVANLAAADTLFGFSRFCYFILALHPNALKVKKSLRVFEAMCICFYLVSLAAVLLMAIERLVVITKPLTWNEILPQKRMLLFMLGSWIAVILLIVLDYFIVFLGVSQVWIIFVLVILSSTAAVNVYMFKKLNKKDGSAGSNNKSMHLQHKASILVLWLAVIVIATTFPSAILRMIIQLCNNYKFGCNLNTTVVFSFLMVESLNFIVNPFVYIWKDRLYRNAFCQTFKIKKQF